MFTFLKNIFKKPTVDSDKPVLEQFSYWEHQRPITKLEHRITIDFTNSCSAEIRKTLAEMISLYKEDIQFTEEFKIPVDSLTKELAYEAIAKYREEVSFNESVGEVKVNGDIHIPYKKEYIV